MWNTVDHPVRIIGGRYLTFALANCAYFMSNTLHSMEWPYAIALALIGI